ncbi:MAG: GBS Bsp-like repeat-containing protein, partial [Lachnospiraceae bacterium]|nr:GBS Bsp-like repeat-containing protein [Lachnospiraceae bacterium]
TFLILAVFLLLINTLGKGMVSYAAEPQTGLKASIELTTNMSESKFYIVADYPRELEIYESIQAKVWSSENGTDDMRWYTLYEMDGSYERSISIKNHKNNTGKYYVYLYLTNTAGEKTYIGKKSISINGIDGGKISFANINNTAGTRTVKVGNIETPATIKKVEIGVWSVKGGTDDIKWYDAKQKGGYWYIEFDAVNHKYVKGKYKFKAKIWDNRGVVKTLKEKTATIKVNRTVSTLIEGDSNQSNYDITIKNVRYAEKIKNVQVAVWSEKSGNSDKKLYTATKTGEGTYSAKLSIKQHKSTGVYHAYTYVTLAGKSKKLVNKNSFVVGSNSVSDVQFAYHNNEKGSVQVNISGISSPAKIKKVELRVYSKNNGKDDLVKSKPIKIGNTYRQNISVVDHNYESGTYQIEVYVSDSRGITERVYHNTIELTCLPYYKDKTSFAGIDVSKFQGNINWHQVKASGIDFAIIRVGYRGYTYGNIIEDPYFETNIKGALAAGLDVGVYFFSQAVTEQEAREEAAWTKAKIAPYKITYPVVIDTEYVAGGRANGLSAYARTAVVKAFCDEVKTEGYVPAVYASKSWLEHNLIMSSLSGYDVWLARYASAPEYRGSFQIWQYTNKGSVPGINGYVDRNVVYKKYY